MKIQESNHWLRSEPGELSNDDVRELIRKHNFEWRNVSDDSRNKYTDNGNGTITDSVTGLMWQKSGSGNYMSDDKTQAYIDNLNRQKFAGYNDWRLPTLNELISLLEKKKVDSLYINPLFDRKQEWCWTSDTRTSGGDWDVNLYSGLVNWYYSDGGSYVRAVRSQSKSKACP